jgi:hypothetical protein
MYLKRVYAHGRFDHIECLRAGSKQKFSGGLVEAAVAEGWMTLGQGQVVLHCQPADLSYRIVRIPGRYCCHCGEKLPDDATGELARAHVAAQHAGVRSPDPENPSGYSMLNAYECAREGVAVETPPASPRFLDRVGRWLGVRQ